ncbi:MAG: FAD-binding monooxygenase [Pseudonocardiales bacterium]|nr:FAD-binding monooxygenase [Pseudonocardiales bacterium]
MPKRMGEHAVVLGASMAGSLAARVLTEAYRKVTVIDRDILPDGGLHRRSVPQGRHLHVLLPRGREVLEELFPGFTAGAVQAGAPTGDGLGAVRVVASGHRLRQVDVGRLGLFVSRPFLEGQVRARLRALPEITFVEGSDIASLMTTPDRRRITGVTVRGPEGHPQHITADLVVDATGRGSRTPIWLREWGYSPPVEDRVEIRLGYATRTLRLRPGAIGNDKFIAIVPTVDNPRTGALGAMEDGRHILTLGGLLGNYPPTDPAGFDAFATSLAAPDIAKAIQDAQPLDDPVAFRFPASVRHRYERLRAFPDGLLVIGDAVSSFNPIYGQGMTVAAQQALALRRLLARTPQPAPHHYFRLIATTIDPPWDIAVGADLAFPDVPGPRTTKTRLVNAYVPRLLAAAAHDATLSTAFAQVQGLIDRPESLLRPDRMLRVWWTNRRHPPQPTITVTPHPHLSSR